MTVWQATWTSHQTIEVHVDGIIRYLVVVCAQTGNMLLFKLIFFIIRDYILICLDLQERISIVSNWSLLEKELLLTNINMILLNFCRFSS